MANFNRFISIVLRLEGGYQNLTADTGNYNSLGQNVGTNKGISAKVYETWLGYPPSVSDMKAITDQIAISIYKANYWDKIKGDQINNEEVATIIADHAVNAGVYSAGKITQQTLNERFNLRLSVDGIIGNQTVSAINSVNQYKLFDGILSNRERFYKNLNQPKFLQGWLNRLKPFYEDLINLSSKYGKKASYGLFFLGIVGFSLYMINKQKNDRKSNKQQSNNS
ncbi:glycoside hydrolase family 108 protein [Aurantibacter aestuarii]|uniref:Uncharacterized protein n=1 Tax=Aurantibacter aestuarii TaxID=1266046 RepID=A0A2T1NEK0_9FLAO|nr:glycosyl hydrolase 108 family protein [Aurantibacter aestuarii]PSG90875.1 hypothetical protein C7H52_06270 [Aurantibacter aestuarii]